MKMYLIMLIAAVSVNFQLVAKTVFNENDLWFSDEYLPGQVLEDNGVCVTLPPDKRPYTSTEVFVPAKVNHKGTDYNVVNLDKDVFSYNPNLRTLEIEAPIENLYGIECNTCPNLEKVLLPPTLKNAGGFNVCPKLLEIEFPEGTRQVFDNSFSYSGIRRVSFPKGFHRVGRDCFVDVNLEDVTFNSVRFIYEGSFSNGGENFKILKFPSNLKGIFYDAFSFNNFDEIWFENPVVEDDYPSDVPEVANISQFVIDYAAFWKTSVKRIYCKSTVVPLLFGPDDGRLLCEQEPYDPSSGEEPWVFPFMNEEKGITRLADLSQIRLYVPVGCRELYAADQYWGNFTIEEMDFAAVEAPEADGGSKRSFEVVGNEGELTVNSLTDYDLAVKVYNTSGGVAASVTIPVGSSLSIPLPTGIYIAVASGTTAKAAVK